MRDIQAPCRNRSSWIAPEIVRRRRCYVQTKSLVSTDTSNDPAWAGFAVEDFDIGELGCDFFMAGCLTLHTPRDETLSAGIVYFEVDGMSPDGTVDALSKRGIIATTTPYADSYARLTPSIYNSMAEVDESLSAIGELGYS